MKLQRQILAGFAVGLVVGSGARFESLRAFRDAVIATEPVGVAFIRLISMVVVPLVIASVFVGVASLGDIRSLGRIGGKTLAYFLGTPSAAALIGLIVAIVTRVGAGLSDVERDALVSRLEDSAAGASAAAQPAPTLLQTLGN